VAGAHPLAFTVLGGVGLIVAPQRLLGGFGQRQLAFEQGLDRRAGRFADHAVRARFVSSVEQAGSLRGLAQQLGAGPLAQHIGRQRLAGGMERPAVDAGHEARGVGAHEALLHAAVRRERL
jgi:hypothetical protein